MLNLSINTEGDHNFGVFVLKTKTFFKKGEIPDVWNTQK